MLKVRSLNKSYTKGVIFRIPGTLYHLLMKAESMKYFDIVSFLRKERDSITYYHKKILRGQSDLLQVSLV